MLRDRRFPGDPGVEPAPGLADVKLPKVISSHMVLQRERAPPIWGWADPDEEVTVRLDDATVTAKADPQGDWKVVLPAVKADGKAHSMTVSGKNKIELDDILIGDVRIGSGQRNMEFGLGGSIGAKEVIAAANCPQIRLLHVEKVQAPQPAKDIVVAGGAERKKGQPSLAAPTGPAWKACTPQSVPASRPCSTISASGCARRRACPWASSTAPGVARPSRHGSCPARGTAGCTTA